MNNRIQELAKQCWDNRLDGIHFDQEQFAQLIVEECAAIIESQDIDPSFRNRLAYSIRERFGVNE